MSWWDRASRDERLAQIDAGIELGMSAHQVAMNCGCVYDGDKKGALLDKFARYYGRHFQSDQTVKMKNVWRERRTHEVPLKRAKTSYFSGEPVDFWNEEA